MFWQKKKKEQEKTKNTKLNKLPDNFWLDKEDRIKTKMNLSAKDTKVYFGALGGMGDRIGSNLYLYGTCGDWIIVDMGIGFPSSRMAGAECVIPDTTFLNSIKDKIKGILLTHSHEDHYGAIPYIWEKINCPIYGTSFAIKMVQNKISEYDIKTKIPFQVIDKNGAKFKLGAFEIEYIHMTHSIPQACGIAIKTKQGNIFHTGDWKLDPDPLLDKPTDIKALKTLANNKVLAIMGDSTNAILNEHTSSEKEVRTELKKVISKIKKGKIVLTCFATNVARIETIYFVAKQTNRKLVVLGRSMENIINIATSEGYLKDFDYISTDSASKLEDNNLLYLCTGTQGEPRSALTRIANKEYRDLKLKPGDTVIFSSKMIPGNEEAILNVQNNLALIGVNIITTYDNPKIHASGHAGIPELKELYTILKPQNLIPVHGEAIHLAKHKELGDACHINTKIIQNGEFIVLEKNKAPKTIEIVKTGEIIIDGTRKLEANSEIFTNRRKLNYNGAIFITIVLHKTKLVNVEISSLGVMESDKSNSLKTKITNIIKQTITSTDKSKFKDNKYIKETITKDIKHIFMNLMDKKPMPTIHIINI